MILPMRCKRIDEYDGQTLGSQDDGAAKNIQQYFTERGD